MGISSCAYCRVRSTGQEHVSESAILFNLKSIFRASWGVSDGWFSGDLEVMIWNAFPVHIVRGNKRTHGITESFIVHVDVNGSGAGES